MDSFLSLFTINSCHSCFVYFFYIIHFCMCLCVCVCVYLSVKAFLWNKFFFLVEWKSLKLIISSLSRCCLAWCPLHAAYYNISIFLAKWYNRKIKEVNTLFGTFIVVTWVDPVDPWCYHLGSLIVSPFVCLKWIFYLI